MERLPQPVDDLLPFHRLSYIFNFVLKFDVGMIKKRFLEHHGDGWVNIFLATINVSRTFVARRISVMDIRLY
jgi:hypothetical protein